MSIKFRMRKKEGLEIQFPPEVAQHVRRRACDERRSISEVGTEIMLTGLGWNPAEFGIDQPLQEPTPCPNSVN